MAFLGAMVTYVALPCQMYALTRSSLAVGLLGLAELAPLLFVAIRFIRRVPPPESAEKPTLRSIAEGVRYARSRQELIGTYVVDFVAMVFGMPLALFPALAVRLAARGRWAFSMRRPPWAR